MIQMPERPLYVILCEIALSRKAHANDSCMEHLDFKAEHQAFEELPDTIKVVRSSISVALRRSLSSLPLPANCNHKGRL